MSLTDRTLILVAGLPGTGKTYLLDKITSRYPDLIHISLDDIKERSWDTHGFRNLKERYALDDAALRTYLDSVDSQMKNGRGIISDYPFGAKQHARLERSCTSYHYRPLTIRLVADLDVLFTRQRERDLDPVRHPGHVFTRYEPGAPTPDRSLADNLPTRQEFISRCTDRGYQSFSLGPTLPVVATDLTQVNYPGILDWLAAQLANDSD
ncbi:AAA family ATPase [Acidipropionibacterium acidipropionici]|uniref:Kinase n=1 Tax=Acidipropionibacterium acidipropionici TaxID=1748 RepID=A0AAC8YCA4_9ACTN|nr:AAA family ATPase [Acidipropionibacterium acidipropionici]AMS04139.1 hypothetical protein AXH35_00215 [Acidipropionibacterium acidipropionici]